MGLSPSAPSMWNLYPGQRVVWPLALRFGPLSQAVGRSSIIASRDSPPFRGITNRVGAFGRTSPVRGPVPPYPRLPAFFFGVLAFGFDLARASITSIAVESRAIGPTHRPINGPANAASTRAVCLHSGTAVPAHAREKGAALGIDATRAPPHNRRKVGSHCRRSIRSRGVGPRGWPIPDRLGDKGSRQSLPVFSATPPALRMGDAIPFDRLEIQHRNPASRVLGQRSPLLSSAARAGNNSP